jgi:hypothetical protein
MSEIYVEPISSTEPAESASYQRSASWRWPKRIALALVLLWIAAEGVSLAIQHTRLRRILTSQFAAAIGRPVEVGSYHFTFWDGPVIEARSVVVGEDPRFGAEYFLRADSMTVRLRWRSLFRGRIEFGAISLIHPSLNLVRNSTGEWNVAEWLPRPSAQALPHGFAGPVTPSSVKRFERIEIDDGRINVKLVDKRLPFALVGVTGTAEMNGADRWKLSFQASPWRAAVVLQQPGFVQVLGEVGGTSSRLRPAAVNLRWTDASLPDVLRLVRNNDFGIRGILSLSVDARTEADQGGWTFSSRAQVQQLHRWDLALRPDNPSLNVNAIVVWDPSSSYLDLRHATIEAPRSNVNVSGRLDWSAEPSSRKHLFASPHLVSASAEIDASDAFAWAHAFHPGIADALYVRGVAHVDAATSGWPPHLERTELSTDGLDFSGPALSRPAHVGPLQIRYANDAGHAHANRHGIASIAPISVSWGTPRHPAGSLRFEDIAKPNDLPVWRISGSTIQVRDLIAGANTFGWNIARGWDVTGPFACDLRWREQPGAHLADALREISGWMEFGMRSGAPSGAVLRAPFLNLPIEQINGRIELKPGFRHLKLTSAQAFGARWSGMFERRDQSMPWQFDLAADQLSAADLDRWLNPRWRESFIDRMLPFLNSRSETSPPAEDLQAIGHVTVGHLALARLIVSRVQGDLALHGHRITVANADGQFYGGELTGSFDANLEALPSYHADLEFSRVDASELIALAPALAGFSAVTASGQGSFAARGAGRSDLISSLTCRGAARVTRPELLHFDLWRSLGEKSSASDTRFPEGSADFSCSHGQIQFQRLQLVAGEFAGADGSGTFDFGGGLDLRFKIDSDLPEPPAAESAGFRLTGTLAAPQASPILPSGSRRSR